MDVTNVTRDAEAFTCNAYVVDGAVSTLVDAGTMAGVTDVIADHVDTLDRVVLTHQHGDHVGELDAVLDRFDATLFAYGEHPRRTHELTDGQTVQIGDDDYEVVHSPGHAPDHVAFVGRNAIFSGDVVVYNDGAFDDGSFGRTDMAGQSRERLIESLREILDRLPDSVTAMYAGHGDSFHANGNSVRHANGDSVRDVIERALSRAERREPKYDD